ncbi:hypothetical protein ACFYU9_16405 [Streptomyces sp. NPDC004327]|uniref:hypothetical protein n=1 Tax=Streptomyces sp. NPDC004327 TaxID=3364699 RepID=UPI00367CBC14
MGRADRVGGVDGCADRVVRGVDAAGVGELGSAVGAVPLGEGAGPPPSEEAEGAGAADAPGAAEAVVAAGACGRAVAGSWPHCRPTSTPPTATTIAPPMTSAMVFNVFALARFLRALLPGCSVSPP